MTAYNGMQSGEPRALQIVQYAPKPASGQSVQTAVVPNHNGTGTVRKRTVQMTLVSKQIYLSTSQPQLVMATASAKYVSGQVAKPNRTGSRKPNPIPIPSGTNTILAGPRAGIANTNAVRFSLSGSVTSGTGTSTGGTLAPRKSPNFYLPKRR